MFATMDDLIPIISECINAGRSVEISPRGVSMLPLIREGRDSVVLSPLNREIKKYDLPLYRRADGSYVLHRIVDVKKDVYTAIGDNQYVYENGISRDQIIAIVTAIRRDDKLISVESLSYRFYTVFHHATRPVRHFVRRVIGRIRRLFK